VRTKNAKAITVNEAWHMARVKELPCVVCDAAGPSEAHHIEQGKHYTVVALCVDCHRGAVNGWHGQRRMWAVRKMNELDALNETIRRLNCA
jgi:hypothetical protein